MKNQLKLFLKFTRFFGKEIFFEEIDSFYFIIKHNNVNIVAYNKITDNLFRLESNNKFINGFIDYLKENGKLQY